MKSTVAFYYSAGGEEARRDPHTRPSVALRVATSPHRHTNLITTFDVTTIFFFFISLYLSTTAYYLFINQTKRNIVHAAISTLVGTKNVGAKILTMKLG